MEGAAVPARGGDGGGRAAALFVRALLDGARGEVPVLIAPAGVTRSYGDVLGLHLPASFPMHGQGSALARRARFAAAAHLAAHVRFGDQRLARGALRPIQIVLVSLFEDARVERLAARELPGLARLWAELHTAQPTDLATFPALCARLSRALLVPSYEDPHPIIRKARTLFFHPHHPLGSAQGSRRLGSLLGNDVGQMRLAFNAKDYVVEPAYRDDHRLLWQEPPPKADDEAAPLEQADVEERVGPRETLAPGTTGATGERPAGRARAATPISTAPDETARARGSATYPEWDYSIGVSRPHWCTVRDLAADAPAAPGDDADIATFVGRGPLARVTNLARQLRAYDLVKHRRAREGDVVDLDAAVGALVDRRAGVAPDTRVYQRTARRRRDLAVLLLLDLSASTADPVREQRVIDLESRAAVLLGELLAGTGELFAVHGFSSNGRHQVDYQRFKELDAPWETTTRRRLRDLSPRLSTRMGAAIRHAGRCLAGVHRRGRLILLLTDGEPSDVDAPDPSYLPHDARHAVAEQRRRGLHVFAVGLGSAAAAGVRRIFGESSSCVVDRLSALPDALPRIYARLVR
jgi:nitric oxide reductase activation protein